MSPAAGRDWPPGAPNRGCAWVALLPVLVSLGGMLTIVVRVTS